MELFIKYRYSIQNVIVMNLKKDKRFICVTALFADSRISGGAEMLIKSSFMDIVYFLCAFSSSEVLGKNTSMWN